jgi:hypothetical protein
MLWQLGRKGVAGPQNRETFFVVVVYYYNIFGVRIHTIHSKIQTFDVKKIKATYNLERRETNYAATYERQDFVVKHKPSISG